jgi:acyl-CoA synthetase (AMP-forming)/AMP-acid ligase II/alkylation response protein AidB-like acyl-CoA dehydrogenase/acyl carrier protein
MHDVLKTPRARALAVALERPKNLVDMLRQRAQAQPDATACLYLSETEDIKGELSFAQLDAQAMAIAARLQGLDATGECAVLLYPPGLEFLTAFFGCLYAGVVAVPLPVPRANSSVAPIASVIDDVNARMLLTTDVTMGRLRRLSLPALEHMACLPTEDTPQDLARAWREPPIASDAIAYLQYTSGSTASRKGVVVGHDNVIANLLGIAERFRHHQASVCVNWLPHTHDLGLVSGMLQPLFHGHLGVMMAPTAFVQQPIRWLNAITRYRGTYTNSPNFGYDLCVRRTTSEQRARLDLGSWEVALNGAEPVRRQTVEEFASLFAPCGFRPETMFPAYGLAEATLVVSGGLKSALPIFFDIDAAELERDRAVESPGAAGARSMVGCGHPLEHTEVAIVDPATGRRRQPGEIGEIWVHGPGVAHGYWRREDESEQTMRARIVDGDGRPYLRTGDLGFLHGSELVIAGRLKDLIIVRGNNHYPQDIEWTIEQSHSAFRPGCTAAFAIEESGHEQLVVAVEVERDASRALDADELWHAARRAVAEQHELQLHTLVLLKTGTIPRTTSGKIQRRKCRTDFLAGDLTVVWTSPAVQAEIAEPPVSSNPAAPEPRETGTSDPRSVGDLCDWLREYADTALNSRLMDERRSLAPHVLLDLGNRGVLGLQVPREYGGLGFGHRDALRVLEQLGAIDQTLAMMTIVHNVLGIGPILAHGEPSLKARWLPSLASGRELVAFAITEPEAGSNPQAIVSSATPEGPDTWRLHGQKSWSGTAGWASVINVFVQNMDDEGRHHGISGFAVPRGTAGLRMGPEALTLGMRGMVQNTVYFEGAQVTRSQRLGEIGAGMRVAQEAMMQGRLAIGAAAIGGIKRCAQLLLRYASRRAISTGRLIDNPVLQDRASAWMSAVEGLEGLVARIAAELDAGRPVPVDAYVVCKVAGAEWLWRAADDLVQFLGGRGYIETNIAAQLLRDARVARILEGPTEPLTMFLGSRAINDNAGLRQWLEAAGASSVARRLADAAEEIAGRSVASPRYGGATEARRWAYALIGQVAVDAMLLAETQVNGRWRPWAEERFEAAIAAARQRAGSTGVSLDAADLSAAIERYHSSIGDIEQTLAGEDDQLDPLLRRASAKSPRVPAVPEPAPAPALRAMPADVPGAEPIDTAAIERFIVRWLAKELKLPEGSVDPKRFFFDYGLDSVTAVMLVARLEEWLRIEVNPELPYEVPVIARFAAEVARRQAAGSSRA